MDGWKDKKYEKNRWMVGWQKIYEKKMDGWMDGKKYMKNEKIWMVGWIKKQKKQMDGWMDRKI